MIDFLLRRGEREMALHTLRRMASGGMYDQVGGGFARYSVDARWIVPHFEKMLYDNALLARAYLHAWQVTGEALFLRVVTETLDWALRELRQEEGGFASALDADSEGVEGKFYVWTPDQVRDALPEDLAPAALQHFAILPGGNFEGASIPVRATPDPERLDEIKAGLLAAREQRVRPGPRRQAADRLERADDLRARRGRRRARARRLPGRRGRGRGVRRARHARRRRPPAAHLQPRPGEAPRLPRGPRVPARGARSRSTRRPSTTAGSRRRARSPTRSSSASPTPSAAASSPSAPTTS